jgi:hypothetical protein
MNLTAMKKWKEERKKTRRSGKKNGSFLNVKRANFR